MEAAVWRAIKHTYEGKMAKVRGGIADAVARLGEEVGGWGSYVGEKSEE
jgi:hypothetical protein